MKETCTAIGKQGYIGWGHNLCLVSCHLKINQTKDPVYPQRNKQVNFSIHKKFVSVSLGKTIWTKRFIDVVNFTYDTFVYRKIFWNDILKWKTICWEKNTNEKAYIYTYIKTHVVNELNTWVNFNV